MDNAVILRKRGSPLIGQSSGLPAPTALTAFQSGKTSICRLPHLMHTNRRLRGMSMKMTASGMRMRSNVRSAVCRHQTLAQVT